MPRHGTLSSDFPGWYIQFQADVLLQMPRPGEISEGRALAWHDNRGDLKKALRDTLAPAARNDDSHPLLKTVGTVPIAPRPTPFVASECFILTAEIGALAKISYIHSNFSGWFLAKKEKPALQKSPLRYGDLLRSSPDGLILAELGGERKAKINLAEVFALMQGQPNGELGPLLTNGYANIFYVRDVGSVLRAVYVFWDGGGWRVGAIAVTNPVPWNDGDRVFSRNS